MDGNGVLATADVSLWTTLANGGAGAGTVLDLNRDGFVDSTDRGLISANLGTGLISGALSFGAIDNPLGYAGYHYHREMHIYLARHRWFDPELGRWLQRDPAGYVDGLNLYLYGLGSPFVFVDPMGLLSDSCWWNPFSWRWDQIGEEMAAAGEGFVDRLAEGARDVKTSIEDTIKDVVIIGGHALDLVPAEELAESGLVNDLVDRDVQRALDGEGTNSILTVGSDVVRMTGEGLADAGRAIASGDPDAIGAGLTSVGTSILTRGRSRVDVTSGGTYSLRDPATADVAYVGRTQDLARRQGEHARDARFEGLRFQVERRTSSYDVMRGHEQRLYNRYNPPLNRIRPIGPRNPNIQKYLDAADGQ